MEQELTFEERLQKYQMMVNKLADDIFDGDKNCLAGVLQQISIHYGLMEMTILEPLYVGWLHLLEHGFNTQEEVGEAMWNVQQKVDKQIWTRMSSFLIIEWIRLKKANKL